MTMLFAEKEQQNIMSPEFMRIEPSEPKSANQRAISVVDGILKL
jgi:hypothetical protein